VSLYENELETRINQRYFKEKELERYISSPTKINLLKLKNTLKYKRQVANQGI